MNPSSRYSGEVDVMVSRELSKFFFLFSLDIQLMTEARSIYKTWKIINSI